MRQYFDLFSPRGVINQGADIKKERSTSCTCFAGEFCFRGKQEFPLSPILQRLGNKGKSESQ